MTRAGYVLGAASAVILLATLVYFGIVSDLDKIALLDIVGVQTPGSLKFWRYAAWFGAPSTAVTAAVLLVLVLCVRNKRQDAKFIAIVIVAASALDMPLKYLVHRPRPTESFTGTMPASFSFPSGHVLFATALYFGLATVLAKYLENASRMVIWFGAGIVVSVVALSRLCLGVHYPSDVLGGLLSGWLCISIACWAVRP